MDISKIAGTSPYATAGKLSGKKENSTENKSTLQANQSNEISGVKINISNEARSLQSSGLHKLTDHNNSLCGLNSGEFKSALYGGTSWGDFVEFTDPSLEVPRGEGLLILSDDSQKEVYRKELINSAAKYDERDSVGNFKAVASKYLELRKGIEEKYSGDELVEQLKWLDESYDNATTAMAERATFDMKSTVKLYEFKVRVNNDLAKHQKTHGHTLGIPVKDTAEYDKDGFKSAVNSLTKNITDSIKHYGTLAKQYMLEGNVTPTTEEGMSNFSVYLNANTDSSKGIITTNDLDMLNTIFTSNYADQKNAKYSALEKLQGSGLSDSIKSAIVRMTTHGDRMFSIVPKGFEEREQALYKSMLKWQKEV